MSQREKRVVTKPTRYQTTSEEETERTSTAPRPPIDQDIHDLRMVLQEQSSTSSHGVPSVNPNISVFQNTYAVSVPVLEGFADPGTSSSARATVIHSEPLQQNTAPTQPPDNGRVGRQRLGRMRSQAYWEMPAGGPIYGPGIAD
ncbi:uncharacterized protein LOC143367755 [Andrena cerasifolii]|uniref:uncharacterized protein LOC143367755 n=1 Tax=Andrena cerasifolii TaxID=2819439 RepID=UPI00403822E2